MTEYWVSQGNKWCDYCKIFISNNPVTIRTHEYGQRHKENVAKKLATIRKDAATKEKEKQQAIKDLERIEVRARQSYEKDLAASKKAELSISATKLQGSQGRNLESDESRLLPTGAPNRSAEPPTATVSHKTVSNGNEWTYDEASGYYLNAATGYYYDANSGLYYSDILGKWTTQDEAFKASQEASKDDGQNVSTKSITVVKQDVCSGTLVYSATSKVRADSTTKDSLKISCPEPPGMVLPVSQSIRKQVRGLPSSLEVGKKRRMDKTGSMSKEERAALAAREAAKKRTEEREKGLLGLYQSY